MIPRWIGFYREPGQVRAGTTFDKEFQGSGYADELWAQINEWQESGYLLPRWRHPEPGTIFEGMGPPGTTVRVYYAEHAGQLVLLHVATRKSGRGKLSPQTKQMVEQRLQKWKAWFPKGAKLDSQGRLVAI